MTMNKYDPLNLEYCRDLKVITAAKWRQEYS
jgi:hypothetical protein